MWIHSGFAKPIKLVSIILNLCGLITHLSVSEQYTCFPCRSSGLLSEQELLCVGQWQRKYKENIGKRCGSWSPGEGRYILEQVTSRASVSSVRREGG